MRFYPEKVESWMAHEDEVCDIVALLIQMGADVNATGDEDLDCESAGTMEIRGKTPLCAAVQRGSPKLVRMLLEAKADVNHTASGSSAAYGPDDRNPFGPGVLKAESFLGCIRNGSVGKREASDPRKQHDKRILHLLRNAEKSAPPTQPSATTGRTSTARKVQTFVKASPAQRQPHAHAKPFTRPRPQVLTQDFVQPHIIIPANSPKIQHGAAPVLTTPTAAKAATPHGQPAQPAIRPLTPQHVAAPAMMHGIAQPQPHVQQVLHPQPQVNSQRQVYTHAQTAMAQQINGHRQGYAPVSSYRQPQSGGYARPIRAVWR
eukprot:TRINITY_DN16635_c0_g2_i1.p1 TRINITY_DN16635_c0_g2~~TRINITY_DN16635_c0_g2_i1.p1  ORF type:complete len:367 (+),score=18.93 TRINITY_DN16635_c0_g2_i1:148-1101(+)